MSAFVVSDNHINTILQATRGVYYGEQFSYYWNGERHNVKTSPATRGNLTRSDLGQKLLNENIRSVDYRYGDKTEGLPYPFVYSDAPHASPVQLLKLLNSYDYQACETPDWKQTEAYAIVEALQSVAIRRLDGYDEAAGAV